jgi:hypothetical protein
VIGNLAETVAERVVLKEEVIMERVREMVEGGRIKGTPPVEIGLGAHQRVVLKTGPSKVVQGYGAI